MSTSLNGFPITGKACSTALRAAADSQQAWVVKDIETLSGDQPSLELGNIWRAVQAGPVTLTTAELCAALDLASQVVILDVRLAQNLSIELFIEDGEVVECHLS